MNKKEAVIKALNRMAASGRITKLSKGKYYKPEKTVFGELVPEQYQIVKDILEDDGKIIGYLTGLSIYNKLGLTTQVSNTIQIGKNEIRPTFSRGRYTIAFIKQKSLDTRNWNNSKVKKRKTYEVKWVDIKNRKSPDDDLRHQGYDKGCARFARPEGMWSHNGEIFFTCTSGGKNKLGQIWKYTPSSDEGTPAEQNNPATLELFFESDNSLESASSFERVSTMGKWNLIL